LCYPCHIAIAIRTRKYNYTKFHNFNEGRGKKEEARSEEGMNHKGTKAQSKKEEARRNEPQRHKVRRKGEQGRRFTFNCSLLQNPKTPVHQKYLIINP
jgi:hypothetical protein